MADEEKEESQEEAGTLRLEPYVPEGLLTQFATIFSLASTEDEAYLSFYQPDIPYFDAQTKVETIQSARSRCVARIVLTRKGIHTLTELLNKHLAKRLTNEENT